MTSFYTSQKLLLTSIRKDLIKVILLCAKIELQHAYMHANPWSQMPEDLVFFWQNEYPPDDGILEKEFNQRERDALMSLSLCLTSLLEKRERGEGSTWESFDNEDFLTFQRDSKRALLVFPDKDVQDCYESLKDKYGA